MNRLDTITYLAIQLLFERFWPAQLGHGSRGDAGRGVALHWGVSGERSARIERRAAADASAGGGGLARRRGRCRFLAVLGSHDGVEDRVLRRRLIVSVFYDAGTGTGASDAQGVHFITFHLLVPRGSNVYYEIGLLIHLSL